MKNIHFELAQNVLIANLEGELDHHNAAGLRTEIDSAMKVFHTRNLVLDYTKVTFMDSSGIGLAMGRYNLVHKANGVLVIIPGSQYVSRILGLSGIFSIVPKSKTKKLAVEYIYEKGGGNIEEQKLQH